MSDLKDLQQRTLEIRRRYDELNRKDGHGQWGPKDYTMGLVGDLANCLWLLLVLAAHFGTDLEESFHQTMSELDERLNRAMA